MFDFFPAHQDITACLDEFAIKIKPLLQYIIPGKFLRDPNTDVYRARLLYTKYLRKFMYNPSLLNEIFFDPQLKQQFFNTFGYYGNVDFTIYPHCWLRDLALDGYIIGKCAYLADGIVLGTNQVSVCQKYLRVAPIKIGDFTIFDQNCKVGLGTTIGDNCVIGINANIGLKCTIGANMRLAANSSISHGSTVGKDVTIGNAVCIGDYCYIEPGASVPDYLQIPKKCVFTADGKIVKRNSYR